MVIRLRTKDQLENLLSKGQSPAWVVSKDRESKLTRVEVYQFDGKRVIKGEYSKSKSERRKSDDRLIVGFINARIESSEYKWVGQNPVKYVSDAGYEEDETSGGGSSKFIVMAVVGLIVLGIIAYFLIK
ncbi:MAG: hypothetical protein ACXITV_12385 [Luteibaculaceae bacterium]